MPRLADSYDYIIIGAGSAGCVLANRLTEEADATVLVLERGGFDATAMGAIVNRLVMIPLRAD